MAVMEEINEVVVNGKKVFKKYLKEP